MTLLVHAIEERSRANGPGVRFVVWVQGCDLGCLGCFNPATHKAEGDAANLLTIAAIEQKLLAAIAHSAISPITGLTVSGGEPLQQIDGSIALLQLARKHSLSTLMFSGYTIDEIRAMQRGPEVLALLDVLVDGRYRSDLRLGEGLRGSANQQVHLLSDRFTLADIDDAPLGEVRIGPGGDVVLTGVVPLRLKK